MKNIMNFFKKRKKLTLTITMIFITSIVTSLSIYFLYRNTEQNVYDRLNDIVNQRESTIHVLHEHLNYTENEILNYLKNTRRHNPLVGKSGEVVIAKKKGDSILFLIPENVKFPTLQLKNTPMYLALNKQNGILKGKDYLGYDVFSSYIYNKDFGWGIVAKIQTKEVNKPYIITTIIIILISITSLIMYIHIFNKLTNTIINDLIKKEQELLQEYEIQKENEQKLKEANEKLSQLNETKDKFFSIVSHDLASPFASILSFSEILYDDYNNYTDEERLQNIQYIKESSKNALNLLQNLLDWSLSQDERIKYSPKIIDISTLINDTIKLLSSQALLKDIKLISRVPLNTYCHTDINMFKTILRNLISNAIKFTNDKGTIEITSEKIMCKTKNYIKINVIDNGIGIKKENIGKLFKIEEKFKSFGTHKEKGAGLGLIICRDFVKMMGGKMMVKSEFGKGSTFSFTLLESMEIN